MKAIIFSFALLWAVSLQAQSHSCCDANAPTPTAEFANLGEKRQFQAAHANPKGFVLENPKGQTLTFLTADGATGSGYYLAAEKNSGKYLIVIHEWWGLNDYVRNEAERLHGELGDVNILALDLYDGKVATDRKQAAEYMQGASEERIRAIIRGALNNIGSDAKVQTIGWCFGGGWSHQTAIMAGSQSVGCVMYYGMPETDVDKLGPLEAPVLGIFAGKDKWINADVVAKFEAAMQSADKTLTVKSYDAEHAFANPTRDIYDEKSAKDANALALKFLQGNFE